MRWVRNNIKGFFVDRLFSEEMLRTGFNCKKWCSNGKTHETCVKLIDDKDMKVIIDWEFQ